VELLRYFDHAAPASTRSPAPAVQARDTDGLEALAAPGALTTARGG